MILVSHLLVLLTFLSNSSSERRVPGVRFYYTAHSVYALLSFCLASESFFVRRPPGTASLLRWELNYFVAFCRRTTVGLLGTIVTHCRQPCNDQPPYLLTYLQQLRLRQQRFQVLDWNQPGIPESASLLAIYLKLTDSPLVCRFSASSSSHICHDR